MFTACREAYDLGCKSYSREFGAVGGLADIWFNPVIDILFLYCTKCIEHSSRCMRNPFALYAELFRAAFGCNAALF